MLEKGIKPNHLKMNLTFEQCELQGRRNNGNLRNQEKSLNELFPDKALAEEIDRLFEFRESPELAIDRMKCQEIIILISLLRLNSSYHILSD